GGFMRSLGVMAVLRIRGNESGVLQLPYQQQHRYTRAAAARQALLFSKFYRCRRKKGQAVELILLSTPPPVPRRHWIALRPQATLLRASPLFGEFEFTFVLRVVL